MLTFICLGIVVIASIGFFRHRGFHYICCFHAQEYNEIQFKNWLIDNNVYDRKGSLIALLAAAASKYISNRAMEVGINICIVATLAMAILCLLEVNPRKIANVDRQISPRMYATYRIAMIIHALMTISVILIPYAIFRFEVRIFWYWLAVIFLIQLAPIWIVLANRIYLKFSRSH